MKKLISFGLMLVGLVSAQAANYSYQNFLNGWNLCVSNNTTVTAGYTNNLFTYYHGEVYNSFTTNGVGNTNNLAPDAFVSSGVDLFADANGDVVSNAVIVAYIGNTNWIPVVTTNTAGQYFIPPAGLLPLLMLVGRWRRVCYQHTCTLRRRLLIRHLQRRLQRTL
jgi:hypothetical protein